MADTPLYAHRPEWRDVVPVEQYENVNPLAPIMYAEDYRDATSYFRAVVKASEKSERVLELTERIILMNPAHYSAWQYRYETLIALQKPLDVELRYMDPIAVKNLKNYQVWHHRRLLITHISISHPDTLPALLSSELSFLASSLSSDTKNYHTWSYRQWLLSYFNPQDVWDHELDWVEHMIGDDLRNNSAWHHRFFVVWCRPDAVVRDQDMLIRREVIYAKQQISLAPNNPSAWNYLRGVLDRTEVPYSSIRDFVVLYAQDKTNSQPDIVDFENPPPGPGAQLPCVAAVEFLADIHERDRSPEAKDLWKLLAEEYDTVRKRYWEYRIREASW